MCQEYRKAEVQAGSGGGDVFMRLIDCLPLFVYICLVYVVWTGLQRGGAVMLWLLSGCCASRGVVCKWCSEGAGWLWCVGVSGSVAGRRWVGWLCLGASEGWRPNYTEWFCSSYCNSVNIRTSAVSKRTIHHSQDSSCLCNTVYYPHPYLWSIISVYLCLESVRLTQTHYYVTYPAHLLYEPYLYLPWVIS